MKIEYVSDRILRFHITESEYSRIVELGSRRNSDSISVRARPHYGSGEGNHIDGVAGEYIFSILYSLPEPTSNPSGDNGVDFTLDSCSIDSKVNHTLMGYLYFNPSLGNEFKSDIAVLIIQVDKYTYEFRGWCDNVYFRMCAHPVFWPRQAGGEIGFRQDELFSVKSFMDRFPLPS